MTSHEEDNDPFFGLAPLSHKTCPHCGLHYDDLKTGLTFAEVFAQLWSSDPNPETWRQKTRHTVLGRWHEIKKDLWEEHLNFCRSEQDNETR